MDMAIPAARNLGHVSLTAGMSFSTDAAYTAAKMAGVEEAFAAAMKAAIAARAADPLAFIGQQLLTLSAESKRQAIEHVPRSSAARTHWRTAAAAAAAMHRPRTVSISRRPSTAVVESAPAASLTIGTVAKLGEGTSGQAFLVANEWDAREYCLKVVPLTDAAGRAEAANEARLHASVSHAACVRYCYSWLGEDDTCCVLMELCDKDLWACLEASEASEQLALPRQRWSRDLAGALAHVHALGIVHRDLNPWNVFVTKQLEAKLGDFGLSVRMPEGGELSGREAPGAAPLDESAIGSLYSAPELGGEACRARFEPLPPPPSHLWLTPCPARVRTDLRLCG